MTFGWNVVLDCRRFPQRGRGNVNVSFGCQIEDELDWPLAIANHLPEKAVSGRGGGEGRKSLLILLRE